MNAPTQVPSKDRVSDEWLQARIETADQLTRAALLELRDRRASHEPLPALDMSGEPMGDPHPIDVARMNREMCDRDGHVFGVPVHECMRCHHQVAALGSTPPPGPVPAGLPGLFTEIRHLLGRTIECFDENEEERKDLVEMLSKLSAQPFCPKCGPAVMSAEWRCCKCGADMRDGLPPVAYSTSTKGNAP